jgi:predicted negative regulator of RcsB-dependent stress response
MSEIKKPLHVENEKTPFTQFEKYWAKYGKQTSYALAVLVLLIAGFVGYKYYVQEPNEKKATEAMFRAEEYFRMDSAKLALQGDNINAGFLKIMSKYSGTKAANLATFYAGCSYMKLGDYNNAIKYLKDFSTSASQVQARTFDCWVMLILNKQKEEAVAI